MQNEIIFVLILIFNWTKSFKILYFEINERKFDFQKRYQNLKRIQKFGYTDASLYQLGDVHK